MLQLTAKGLYCPVGDFYIDPKGAVDRAVITHAHADHARRGSRRYYCAASGLGLLRARLGQGIDVQGVEFGREFRLGAVNLTFVPAGHILGSAQIRMESSGQVWVASGDYKREADPTCEPFEVAQCDVFVTEATFGTPSYRWPKKQNLGQEILDWWNENASRGENSVLFAYSLGKTQRILGTLRGLTQKPIYCHPAATPLTKCYRAEGIVLAASICLGEVPSRVQLEGELLIVPPSFLKSPQASLLGRRFKTAFASGWMAERGRSGFDRGFVMSDHADWDDLVMTVRQTGARRVYVQHRGAGALVRHLQTMGIKAFAESALKAETVRAQQLSLF